MISTIFRTNNIEGIWSRLKRLTQNFNGINCNEFNGNNQIDNFEYFNVWICQGILYEY